MKAQAAFEYILIVGMVLFFVVSGSILLYNYSSRANADAIKANIHKAGSDIIGSVVDVYYIGESSWETVKVTLPDNVKNITVANYYELVITYDSIGGLSDAVFFSDINMSTNNGVVANHSGLLMLKVTSMGPYVNLTEIR
jgi:hypothetical protein